MSNTTSLFTKVHCYGKVTVITFLLLSEELQNPTKILLFERTILQYREKVLLIGLWDSRCLAWGGGWAGGRGYKLWLLQFYNTRSNLLHYSSKCVILQATVKIKLLKDWKGMVYRRVEFSSWEELTRNLCVNGLSYFLCSIDYKSTSAGSWLPWRTKMGVRGGGLLLNWLRD